MRCSDRTSTLRAARGALVLVALASVLVVVTARTAHACSCATIGPDRQVLQGEAAELRQLELADVVFSARLASVDRPLFGGSTDDPARYRFEVDGVFKGDALMTQDVVTEQLGASCGLEFLEPGDAVLVFADGKGSSHIVPAPGQLYAGLCGGTRKLADAPIPSGFPVARAPTPGASPHAALPIVWILLLVAALLGGTAIGLALWRRAHPALPPTPEDGDLAL